MKKTILVSLISLMAAGAANAELLPNGGVVGTSTFNAKIGDTQTLNTTSKVVVPAINELEQAIENIQQGIDLTGVERTENKTQDIGASITAGEGATDYPSAQAVESYVANITAGLVDETDLSAKQDKATGVTAGNVALWASDGAGKYQTAGQVAITNTAAGIVSGNTGLATGGAVADALSTLEIPQLDPDCIDTVSGVNNCILSQDMNGPGGTLQWVWLRMY